MIQLAGFLDTLAHSFFGATTNAAKEGVKEDIKFTKEGVTALKNCSAIISSSKSSRILCKKRNK